VVGSLTEDGRICDRAYLTSNQTGSLSSYTTVIFDDTSYGNESNWNLKTGVFSAPVSGFYDVKACVRFYSSVVPGTYNYSIQIYKTPYQSSAFTYSESHALYPSATLGGYVSMPISDSVQLDQGDTLEIKVQTNSGANIMGGASSTYFVIHKVS
jgi:hypothetical protein